MPVKRYIVSLTKEEQKSLEEVTKTGKAAAAKINHAKILLKADINRDEGGWKDQAISIALDTSVSTIEQVRQRFVEDAAPDRAARGQGARAGIQSRFRAKPDR